MEGKGGGRGGRRGGTIAFYCKFRTLDRYRYPINPRRYRIARSGYLISGRATAVRRENFVMHFRMGMARPQILYS